MNTRVITVLLALSLGARTAEAANGFNITWDACQAAGGVTEKVFDCADLAALDNIVVSFKPAVDLPGFVGLEAELGITSTGGPLPEYWQLGPGQCNDGGWVVSTTPPPGSGAACLATWAGGSLANASYETPVKGDATRAKLHVWITRNPIGLMSVNEYFGFRVQLSRANAPFCDGCENRIYIALHNVRLLNRVCPVPLRSEVLTAPLVVDQIAANASLVVVDPAESGLALAGTRQNPVPGGEAVVGFSLPDAGPAWLELLDIAGRRVVRVEVGSFGPGQHQVRLSKDGPIPPGVYQLRLTNTQAARVRKTVIVQ